MMWRFTSVCEDCVCPNIGTIHMEQTPDLCLSQRRACRAHVVRALCARIPPASKYAHVLRLRYRPSAGSRSSRHHVRRQVTQQGGHMAPVLADKPLLVPLIDAIMTDQRRCPGPGGATQGRLFTHQHQPRAAAAEAPLDVTGP